MTIKHPLRFVVAALLLGWAVDILFWKSPLGLNFPIWTVLLLAGGIGLVYSEGKRLHPAGWVLAGLAALLSSGPLLRLDELTRFVSILLTLLALLLLVLTARNGFWLFYRLWDWVRGGFELILAALSRALGLLRLPPPAALAAGEVLPAGPSPLRRAWSVIWRVLVGLLIALPILAILGSLLSSADPIFGEKLEEFLNLFKLEKLPEYLFRGFYILLFSYLIGGLLAHTVWPQKENARPGPEKPWLKGFLGPIETGVILGSVDVMFALFVVVQFRYFFAGQANINASGFTYSEYAVRGFNELVTVAVLSLLLYQGLNLIRRSQTDRQRISFRAFSLLLLGLVLVMLVSSWQRLGLYEAAYGFTRLRTYTHLFIPWLGVLLVVTILLELLNQRGRFALALWLVSVGFGLTLMLVNVDGFIVRQNTARAAAGEGFDFDYLSQLSHDGVPAMFKAFQDGSQRSAVHNTLGAQLSCRAARLADAEALPWKGFNLPEMQARNLLLESANQKLWKDFPITIGSDRMDYQVLLNGELTSCYWWDGMD